MAELTVIADTDSTLSQTSPDTNFGAAAQTQIEVVYSGETKLGWKRVVGNFDVSALSGATINSAKLVREIVQVINPSQDAILSRCTRPADWAEDEVTWNDYNSGNAWTDVGGDFDDTGPPAKVTYTEASSTGAHEITGLKDFVQDALDNRSGIVSLIVRLSDEDPGVSTRYVFYTKDEAVEARRWRLVIDYTPPAQPTNPGRRGRGPSPIARGAPELRPVTAARPTRAAGGVGTARPRRPRRTA